MTQGDEEAHGADIRKAKNGVTVSEVSYLHKTRRSN